jgi:hypothetical protein
MPFSMLHIILELSGVFLPIWPQEHTVSIELIFKPLPNILFLIGPSELSLAVIKIILYFTLEARPIRVLILACPMLHPILK